MTFALAVLALVLLLWLLPRLRWVPTTTITLSTNYAFKPGDVLGIGDDVAMVVRADANVLTVAYEKPWPWLDWYGLDTKTAVHFGSITS